VTDVDIAERTELLTLATTKGGHVFNQGECRSMSVRDEEENDGDPVTDVG
jgi:hypothetical protein